MAPRRRASCSGPRHAVSWPRWNYGVPRELVVEAVPVPGGATASQLGDVYDRAVAWREEFACEGAKPIDEPVIGPPDREEEAPELVRRTPLEPTTGAWLRSWSGAQRSGPRTGCRSTAARTWAASLSAL